MSGENSNRTAVKLTNNFLVKIIGLSGGIASGKNFVADVFAKNGAAIFDADKEVHMLLESDTATISEIKKKFPKSFAAGKIDRKLLGEIVFNDQNKLRVLEKILHEKVRQNYQKFLAKAKKEKHKLAVLNIPLLHETDSYKCDKIVAIIASESLRKKRFLARARKKDPRNFVKESNNLAKKFEQIIANQLTNLERKSLADFVVNTNKSKAEVVRQVQKIIMELI